MGSVVCVPRRVSNRVNCRGCRHAAKEEEQRRLKP